MRLLDLTLPSAAENVACDEALLDEAEQAGRPCETLRLWESPRPLVVVGRGSKLVEEVKLDECRRLDVPLVRRASGGAAIVTGPGCLMYAVVLSYELRPGLRLLDAAHRFVLETNLRAIDSLGPGAARQGTSDLTLGGLKCSGNSMRCKRRHFLYHGTLLYDFDLTLVEACLTMPPRQPAYRRQRPHGEFICNLPTGRAALTAALAEAWLARADDTSWPRDRVEQLVASRYGRAEWNS